MNVLDRLLLQVAPRWALRRIQARAVAALIARGYDAASAGRRTAGWPRRSSDASTAAGAAGGLLRDHARDLVRNNGWARNGLRIITRNTVGWGITAKPTGPRPEPDLLAAWNAWAGSTDCDATGHHTFAGLQKLVLRTVAEAGEVLVRRRPRRAEDGLPLPLQLQVLEPDHLDSTKHGIRGVTGGPTIYGVEFNQIGQRVAYWLFPEHPGSSWNPGLTSYRYPAEDILHIFDAERAEQERGVSWFATATVGLKDFDEYEDATLMRQKIAACFAAFVTDIDGQASALGEQDKTTTPTTEMLEPGIITRLPLGKDIKFANPPLITDDGFSQRTLRKVAASLGVTYEDLTGDYSQVNFSSARMSRIGHWANVEDWQWNLMIPRFCSPVWYWAMQAAQLEGLLPASADLPGSEWTPRPMPMTEPDREARANVLMIRSGQKTLSQVIREQGYDPQSMLDEYAGDLAVLDRLKITLDSDARRVTQTGQAQASGSGDGTVGADTAGEPASEDMPPEPTGAGKKKPNGVPRPA